MPVFQSSEELYGCLKLLFEKVHNLGPDATRSLTASRLFIRFMVGAPAAQVWIDGRVTPVRISYGPAALSPELDVHLNADALHRILLKELSLRKALGSGAMKLRGPVWKTKALEEILHHMQDLYPEVAREFRLIP